MKKLFTLHNLNDNEEGVVIDILDHTLRARLIELGFKRGKKIKVLRKSFWNKSVIVLISGQVFGLRKNEADKILLAS